MIDFKENFTKIYLKMLRQELLKHSQINDIYLKITPGGLHCRGFLTGTDLIFRAIVYYEPKVKSYVISANTDGITDVSTTNTNIAEGLIKLSKTWAMLKEEA